MRLWFLEALGIFCTELPSFSSMLHYVYDKNNNEV